MKRLLAAAALVVCAGGAAAADWRVYEKVVSRVHELDASSLRVEGEQVFYYYRESWGTGVGRPIAAVADCASRQRADIEANGTHALRSVYPGTAQAAQVDLACGLAAAARSAPQATGAPTGAGATPAYLATERGCAVLAAGSVGSYFSDPKVNDFWYEVNKEIAEILYDRLALEGHRVVKLLVPVSGNGQVQQLAVEAMARNRCNRLLQLSNTVDEDAQGRFFRFELRMFRMVPQGDRAPGASGTNVRTEGEYERLYRYERTPQVFRTFLTGEFARTLQSDLKASGVLDRLR